MNPQNASNAEIGRPIFDTDIGTEKGPICTNQLIAGVGIARRKLCWSVNSFIASLVALPHEPSMRPQQQPARRSCC